MAINSRRQLNETAQLSELPMWALLLSTYASCRSRSRHGRLTPRTKWALAYLASGLAILWAGTHTGERSVFLAIAVLMLTFFADQLSRKTITAIHSYWWIPPVVLIVLGGGGIADVAVITRSELVLAGPLFLIALTGIAIMLRPLFKSRNRGQYSRWNQTLPRRADGKLATLSLWTAMATVALAAVGF